MLIFKMIDFNEALKRVLKEKILLKSCTVSLLDAVGQVLAEDVYADRDFPPYHRSTKDGFAFKFSKQLKPQTTLQIEDIAPAGVAQKKLQSVAACIEIMTGAVVPEGCDTVVMYEEVIVKDNMLIFKSVPSKGSNIHRQGADNQKGDKLLTTPLQITPAEVGILASVGLSKVTVKNLPKVCVITTGDELVEITETPQKHQIRKSNGQTLSALLKQDHIQADLLHLPDNLSKIEVLMESIFNRYDALLLSGGVSKGKFDYLPKYFKNQGVEKIFHFVKQQPGKPFWFGKHPEKPCLVFSLPGNPVSTFVGYQMYFRPWLRASLGLKIPKQKALLKVDFMPSPNLTKFIKVKITKNQGCRYAEPVVENGSGDLTSLARTDGFLVVPPGGNKLPKDTLCVFNPIR